MMDPEYYVGAFRQHDGIWQTRKFSDKAEYAGPEVETAIWTRKPVYCCKIPGESSWCCSDSQVKINLESLSHEEAAECHTSKLFCKYQILHVRLFSLMMFDDGNLEGQKMLLTAGQGRLAVLASTEIAPDLPTRSRTSF